MRLCKLVPIISSFATSVLCSSRSDGSTEQQVVSYPGGYFIRDALLQSEIIGDVLDDFEPQYYVDIVWPGSNATVELGNEVSPEDVKTRPSVGIYEVSQFGTPAEMEQAVFTLVLTDPDAKSRADPKWSEMCHWILTNITATSGGVGLKLELDHKDMFNVDIEPDSHRHKAKKHLRKNPKKNPKKKPKKKAKKNRSGKCKKDKKGGACLPNELASYAPPGPPPKTGFHRYVFVLLRGTGTDVEAPTERKHWGYGLNRRGVRDWAFENGLEVVSANYFISENAKQ